MATPAQWLEGARPRTLFVSVSPIVAGTGAAAALGQANLGYALLALAVALGLQVGSNYANDYSDGIRGTDEVRVGPVRLVGQRLADPRNVKLAAMLCFGFAGLCGLALVALSQAWLMLPVGIVAVLAAWFYTGGKNPYGYKGLGEISVFVFFGLVATLGTTYVQALTLTIPALLASVGVGSLASAILVANNLRDIPTDVEHGKRTLAVKLGDSGTRFLFDVLVIVAAFTVVATAFRAPWALIALLAWVLAIPLLRVVRSGASGRDLIPVLAGTGRLQLAYAVLLAVGLTIQHALA